MSYKEYGRAYKQLRLKKGMSINEIEVLTGVSKSTISQFENGHSLLSFERLEKILKAIDATLRDYSLVIDSGKVEEFIPIFQEIEQCLIRQESGRLAEIYQENITKNDKSSELIALSAKASYTELSLEEISKVETYFLRGINWGLFDLYALSNLLDQIDIELVIDLLDELFATQELYTYFISLHDYRDTLFWILTKSCLLLMEKKEKYFVQILLRKMERFTSENYLMSKLGIRYIGGCYKYVFVSREEEISIVKRLLSVLEELGALNLKDFVNLRFDRLKRLVN